MMGHVAMGRDAGGPRGLDTWFSHSTGLPIPLLKTLWPLPWSAQDPPRSPRPLFLQNRLGTPITLGPGASGTVLPGNPCPLMPTRAAWEGISGLWEQTWSVPCVERGPGWATVLSRSFRGRVVEVDLLKSLRPLGQAEGTLETPFSGCTIAQVGGLPG